MPNCVLILALFIVASLADAEGLKPTPPEDLAKVPAYEPSGKKVDFDHAGTPREAGDGIRLRGNPAATRLALEINGKLTRKGAFYMLTAPSGTTYKLYSLDDKELEKKLAKLELGKNPHIEIKGEILKGFTNVWLKSAAPINEDAQAGRYVITFDKTLSTKQRDEIRKEVSSFADTKITESNSDNFTVATDYSAARLKAILSEKVAVAAAKK